MRLASLLITAALAASESLAHLGHGVPGHVPLQRRAPVGSGPGMAKRAAAAAPTNDASWQTVSNPQQECSGYSYAPVASFQSQFPTVWDTADIMPGDTEAQAVWTAIYNSGKIPQDVKPKGLSNGSMQGNGSSYNIGADPDCWWTATGCTNPKHPGIRPDIIACPEPHTWGLTFDDGPNCTHNAFYDFLKQNNQKATLFYIGSNVMDWPFQAQRGLTDGHQIGAHTWSHKYMTSLSDTQVFAELYYTVKAIKYVVGVTPTSWRPPYGDVDDRVRAIAQGLGLDTIVWTDDTSDWNIQPFGTQPTATIQANYDSIIAKATSPALDQSGLIVLTHEIELSTMHMMMQEYPHIVAAFKNVAPVHVCLNRTNPYQEKNIVYPTFEQYVAGQRMPSGIPSANQIQAAAASYTVTATGAAAATATSTQAASGGGSGAQAQSGGNAGAASSTKSGDASARVAPLAAVGAAVLGGFAAIAAAF